MGRARSYVKRMRKIYHLSRLRVVSVVLVCLSVLSVRAYAEPQRVLQTNYCDIRYSSDKALSDFFWRISGRRFDLETEMIFARSKVDRLIDRVQAILDMFPDNLHIKIELHEKYKRGLIAAYYRKTNKIVVYADKVTDGILAHEVAHAIICRYFGSPPPVKMQEILTQYVDKHLWDDY